MAATVYVLSALISLLCAFLLLRGYSATKRKLLFWSGLCFAFLTISNALVFVDLVLFPNVDLYPVRLAIACIGMILLIYGLIWGSD